MTAPIEAALEARGRLDRGRTAVRRVDVYGSLFTTEVDERAAPYLDGPDSPVAALSFSVPFNVAVALTDGEHTPRQVGERVTDGAVWRLAERVSVHHDSSFTVAALNSEVPVGAMLRRVGPAVIPYAARSVGPAATVRHLPTLARFVRKRPLPTDLSDADKRMGARVAVTTTDGRTVEATVEHWTGLAAAGLRESAARHRADTLLALEEADAVSAAELTYRGGSG
ncbi:hypothetical protein BRC84_03985 [Halobacteriales archaeon QS_1_68_44]|nr:MAG: hypothetical protein BRC84_03985 [Halobacteriales archaeon QS_1_68_44]